MFGLPLNPCGPGRPGGPGGPGGPGIACPPVWVDTVKEN